MQQTVPRGKGLVSRTTLCLLPFLLRAQHSLLLFFLPIPSLSTVPSCQTTLLDALLAPRNLKTPAPPRPALAPASSPDEAPPPCSGVGTSWMVMVREPSDCGAVCPGRNCVRLAISFGTARLAMLKRERGRFYAELLLVESCVAALSFSNVGKGKAEEAQFKIEEKKYTTWRIFCLNATRLDQEEAASS